MQVLTIEEVEIVAGSGVMGDIGRAIGEAAGTVSAWLSNASDGDPLGGAYGCGKTGIGCNG